MAIATTTFTRFDAIGVREQLSNIIDNVAPTETPFMSNAKVGKAKNTLFEYQTDTLATAVSSNQQLEGDELTTYTAVVPTVRLTNQCEIGRKTVSVSETQQAVDSAGRANEIGYQISKLGMELKRDMEMSLLANKAVVAGSTSSARKTAGLAAWIKTNFNKASDGVAPVYTTTANDVWTEGTARAFTETILKDVLQQSYTTGANIKTIMVGAFNKQAFSAFSGVIELMSQVGKGQARIIGAANSYVGDFGEVVCVPNRFCDQSMAYFIDFSKVQVNYLRPFKTTVLSKTGDSDKRMMIAEYGLQVSNEKGLGIATALSTS
ncbi:MAG: DUF5309 domain-containing protein [Chloroflexi bacterium]|nr:DUF5309 domain-containing protein [Chloroflexota bacterium]